MIVHIPITIPDDSLFRIRLSDGRLFGQWVRGDGTLCGRGEVFKRKDLAHWRITYNKLKDARVEVMKTELVTTYPYKPYGSA